MTKFVHLYLTARWSVFFLLRKSPLASILLNVLTSLTYLFCFASILIDKTNTKDINRKWKLISVKCVGYVCQRGTA